jgi:hypothetical protein
MATGRWDGKQVVLISDADADADADANDNDNDNDNDSPVTPLDASTALYRREQMDQDKPTNTSISIKYRSTLRRNNDIIYSE